MEAWSNIQVSLEDPEIISINGLEKNLGELPDTVRIIRELITRFEICHFKYQRHIKKIKDSIDTLKPYAYASNIGSCHIHHGDHAWKNDTTGRSLIGQQYLRAMKGWLNDNDKQAIPDNTLIKLNQQIQKWLGEKSPDKIRLVRLLIARLLWDWKSYEALQHGGKLLELELQSCRMDICHYAFPKNLDLLLQGIGQMKPAAQFEGCGSYDESRKTFIEEEFSFLNDRLKSLLKTGKSDTNELIKAWLTVCLAKTIKEHVNLSESIIDLNHRE